MQCHFAMLWQRCWDSTQWCCDNVVVTKKWSCDNVVTTLNMLHRKNENSYMCHSINLIVNTQYHISTSCTWNLWWAFHWIQLRAAAVQRPWAGAKGTLIEKVLEGEEKWMNWNHGWLGWCFIIADSIFITYLLAAIKMNNGQVERTQGYRAMHNVGHGHIAM